MACIFTDWQRSRDSPPAWCFGFLTSLFLSADSVVYCKEVMVGQTPISANLTPKNGYEMRPWRSARTLACRAGTRADTLYAAKRREKSRRGTHECVRHRTIPYGWPPAKALACRSRSSSGVKSSLRVAMDQRKPNGSRTCP